MGLEPIRHCRLGSTLQHSKERKLSMSDKQKNNRIDYIEFGTDNIEAVKTFYTLSFGWRFTDYGPDYTSFEDGRIAGGFTRDAQPGSSPLVVLYAEGLEAKYAEIKTHGGRITKEIFSFPGGRRFHFQDPGGNELAVWSDQ